MLERSEINNRLSTIVEELKKTHRIDEAYCKRFYKSFEDQSLRIGVVGQMKAGKSSLVNAVVFGRNILPTGMEPVTVTLTEITYGEEECAKVELLTKQDIEDIKNSANYVGDDPVLSAKAESAKKTIESLINGYERYLDTSIKTIKVADLKEYVAAGGKYCGLAKSVKIFYNNDNLKGITIIDTPGFNDPISSRGDTTKSALSKCHVLLFVHTEDGYDQTDVNLLTEQIRNAGISEMVDIFNKIDLSDEPIQKWPEELAYLTKKRDGMEVSDEVILELLKKSHVYYVSALMALCGLTPTDEMDEYLKSQYSSFEVDFEELCQPDNKEEQQKAFVRYSNVLAVINEINRLSKDGSKFLIEGPLMTLNGQLTVIKNTIQSEIEEKKAKLNSLKVSTEKDKEDIERFKEFMDTVIGHVRSSSLKKDLLGLINNEQRNLVKLRNDGASDEFTREKYPDPTLGSRGRTKANIANYNSFVSGFVNKGRDKLFSLLDLFEVTIKGEINSILSDLAGSSLISVERVEELKGMLTNKIIEYFNEGIKIVVSPENIKEVPDGHQEQWDKLRSLFLDNYKDETILELLQVFSASVEALDFIDLVEKELGELKNDIIKSANKTPEGKMKAADDLKEAIEVLSEEIEAIDNHIKAINELKEHIEL